AARKKADGEGGLPKTLRAKLGLAVGLVLGGLVGTGGAGQARVSAPVVAKEREELIDRIEDETDAADALEDRVDALRADVDARRQEALRDSGGDRSHLVGLLAGSVPVHGPGVRLVVNDAKDAGTGAAGGPRGASGLSDTGRVRDRDRQRAVNGPSASGAAASCPHGRRLAALAAIGAAGDAILVDNKPLVPPYTVLAVGDGPALSDRFQNSADGLYLHALQENYGIRTALSTADDLRLP